LPFSRADVSAGGGLGAVSALHGPENSVALAKQSGTKRWRLQ